MKGIIMARIVKEQEYAARRNAILDVAQRLVGSRGYEQMTIQDILDDLKISKGAFYHYFDSKQALLEALIEHMQDEVDHLLFSIVQSTHLSALDKLQRLFDTLAGWKTARKAFIRALLRVWYTDDNAIVRQKLRAARINRVSPMLADIIHQGVQEGVLTTSYPEQMGEVVVSLVLDHGDALAGLLLSSELRQDVWTRIERTVVAYTHAVERVLDAPDGSLHLVDDETLKEWFIVPVDEQKDIP
jgi:TetR/AcrR family transcriptional repressor of nem operon